MLVNAILEGRLTPDSALPSSRKLARQLAVARNTDMSGFQQNRGHARFDKQQCGPHTGEPSADNRHIGLMFTTQRRDGRFRLPGCRPAGVRVPGGNALLKIVFWHHARRPKTRRLCEAGQRASGWCCGAATGRLFEHLFGQFESAPDCRNVSGANRVAFAVAFQRV
ncbi:MAG: GntR family transcriptional regulator [Gammaproteobacteria bacterium]|nr:GntR family transcriptional regulator [Gammaproteobacteria bacterium]